MVSGAEDACKNSLIDAAVGGEVAHVAARSDDLIEALSIRISKVN